MTSSTTLAERSGHILYSRLIQDCFADLNDVMLNHDAEVYQYVGDEAVITWKIEKKFDRQNCLKLYFDFSAVLINKKEYYLKNYGVIPQFKASINEGKVVVAEIGLTKTEIAYHGEALHIGSRVLNLCNSLKAELLVTGTFFRSLNSLHYNYTVIKNIDLRGIENSTDLYKIHYKNP
ncbi:hypothetical protein GR160_03615 [Flavobacterium sp. Sd200]|uniref:adenylate/guanylate cyclase domain-containing protein n=1 Tax=Flavobacterium sp. Sd200 TaxID=2692211 RepID=UPI00136F75A3|nr:adenylate/guanylate cyclase domain-containing protein [Flavobacterium sp. Sd200]MXN90303.1 hypothetical protein [Flavobacterium sp. Sd200]